MNAYKQEPPGLSTAIWRPGSGTRRRKGHKQSGLRSLATTMRTSRRTRLITALALIVLCGLAVPVLASTHTPKPAQALAAAHELTPGTVITSSDLTVVSASGPASALIPAADKASVIGQSARLDVPTGALLNQADLGAFPPIGSSIVPVSVKPGQYPANLRVGASVAIFPVSNDTTSEQAGVAQAAATGTVTEISPVPGDASGQVVIDLEVADDAAPVIAQTPTVVLVGLDARGDMP